MKFVIKFCDQTLVEAQNSSASFSMAHGSKEAGYPCFRMMFPPGKSSINFLLVSYICTEGKRHDRMFFYAASLLTYNHIVSLPIFLNSPEVDNIIKLFPHSLVVFSPQTMFDIEQ